MSRADLKIIPASAVAAEHHAAGLPAPETVAQRVRRLQAEARQAAKDHVRSLGNAMADLQEQAAEIADGGDAYPAGIRDVARRLAEDLDARIHTLTAILARSPL